MKTAVALLLTLGLTITTNHVAFAKKKTRTQREQLELAQERKAEEARIVQQRKERAERARIRNADCSVCLERARTATTPAVVTECGHIFCETCLNTWLAHHNTCPCCRTELIQGTPAPASLNDIIVQAARNAEEMNDLRAQYNALMNRRIQEANLLSARQGCVIALEALSLDPDYNRYHDTALHLAARLGTIRGMQTLRDLNHTAINACNDINWTPLHWAALSNHTAATEWLIDHGANIHAVSRSGETPLHAAARAGSIHTVRVLIDRGANVNARDAQNFTPLDSALDNDDYEKIVTPFHHMAARMIQEARRAHE